MNAKLPALFLVFWGIYGCSASEGQVVEQAYGDQDMDMGGQGVLEGRPYAETAIARPTAFARAPVAIAAADAGPVRPASPMPSPVVAQAYGGSGGNAKAHAAKPTSAVPQPQYQPQQSNPQQQISESREAPAIIYQGYLKLRVRRTLDAIDAATKAAVEGGGYVQMQTASTLIVRMPATDFEAAMAKFATIGEVLQRQIQAVDVTKQVTDLDARLAVAVQARARLLELLTTVKDVEERLQILEEIKRLTEQIETMQSSLATLRNLTNYFTITIDFESLVASNAVASHASPFEWVRGLAAHRVTLNDGHEHVRMALPAGFVLFDAPRALFGESGAWRAQASDTSMLRAARVANDPKGDALFWAKAVEFEMDGRDEALVDSSRRGQLEVRVFKNKDPKPRWWLIATTTAGDKAWIVEAFFPDEAAYKLHAAAVVSALTTFGVD